MITSAKKQFKRFESFYKNGQLQPHFLVNLMERFENSWNQESDVVKSWFDYCKEKYGEVNQPQLNTKKENESSEQP